MEVKDGIVAVKTIDGVEHTFELQNLLKLSIENTIAGKTEYYVYYAEWEDDGLDGYVEIAELSKDQYEELKSYVDKNMTVDETNVYYCPKV